jgi:hypothetical protein
MATETNRDNYVLNRNYEASSRLNYQFYLWKETLPFILHPSISVPQDAPSIADVATGTAIWLTDISGALPSTAKLDGFDIDLAQCPPKAWLPSNINLRAWNMFEEVPADLVGKYDVVHVRLILLVVQNNDPRAIIENLLKMLKPNGYLQWEELHTSGSYIVKVDPTVEVPAMEGMEKFLATQSLWIPDLPEILENNGFENAQLYHYRDPLSHSKAFFDMHLTKDVELATGALKGTVQGSQMLARVATLYEESNLGAVLCTPKVVCVAKKRG